MICPNCRENNAPTFRFCGMCGTPLATKRPDVAPALDPLSAFPHTTPQRSANAEPPARPIVAAPVVTNETSPPNHPAPPISGPSVLGLNQPPAKPSAPGPAHSSSSDFDLNQSDKSHPSMDVLRDRAFSGLDSFFEPEKPKTGGRRILLLVALLAALGGAVWWTYTNYLSPGEKRPASSSSTNEASSESAQPDKAAPKPAPEESRKTSDAATAATAPPAGVPEGPSANATAPSETTPTEATPKATVADAKPAEVKPRSPAPAPKTAATTKHDSKPEHSVLVAKAPKPAQAAAEADTGDAAFRKGEAYLYGRGTPENCDEAVKNLKAASAKSNAKARSAFGTMYATGHCVPRDLPTSYLWFALALRVDPTNQILEKDLNAVWNQMTPPERQMATRMKQ